MAVITISRVIGSNGDLIADALCDKLGYCRVDKAMLSQIAEQAGVDVKAVQDKEREVASSPKLISRQMTSLYGRAPSAFRKERNLDDKTYARVIEEAMQQFAEDGKAVIVGRGSQMVLSKCPNALHVHLYAPIDVRVQRLVERHQWSLLEAKRRVEASDEQKRLYIRHMHHNANWKDLKHYHLAINTGRISVAAAVEIVVRAAQDVEMGEK